MTSLDTRTFLDRTFIFPMDGSSSIDNVRSVRDEDDTMNFRHIQCQSFIVMQVLATFVRQKFTYSTR